MQVITIKPHRYANELKQVGDKYEIKSKSTLTLYKALGWVSKLDVSLMPESKPILNNGWVSNPLPSTQLKPIPTLGIQKQSRGKRKGNYQRKDLRAE